MGFKKSESRQGAWALSVGSLMIAGLVGALVLVAHQADLQAKAREEQQVEHGMGGWTRELQDRITGQADWDDALENLGIKYDPVWAHANVGQFMHDVVRVERAYVLDGRNQPIFAMKNGDDAAPADFKSVASGAAPLIANVRAQESRRPMLVGLKPFRDMLSKPIQASGVRIVEGEAYLLTVTLVQPDFGHVVLKGTAPLIVTGEALDENFIREFSNRFLLQTLHIHTELNLEAEPEEAHVILRDGGGHPVARMDWIPQRPGQVLLRRVLPPVLICVLLFAIWAARVFYTGRRAAQALVASESRSVHMAFHDSLTGLANRAMFNDRVGHALAGLGRGAPPVGVLALDLDRFKEVNDTFGHQAGDELIIEAATRLKSICRSTDTLVRLGGDEFALLQVGATSAGMAALAERIVAVLSGPVELASGRVFMSVSVGGTLISDHSIESGEALRQADMAMYRAKDEGRGRYCFFEPEMDLALRARKSLEADLRVALAEKALTMVYQPQVDGDGRIVGVEALVRWTHPERGPVSPAFFVPIAEECGLIAELGEFTLRQAFKDSLRWPHLKVAVNVSAVQLRSEQFIDLITSAIRDTGANPSGIELEITEGVLLADDDATHETLRRLRAMGFSLALDDFGTGYSSLSYLRRYPVDKIKIDRSFVTNLGSERDAEAVVGAIVKLAKALNLKVIAEGVETDEQRAGLRRAGCSFIQGYLYSRPVQVDEIQPMLNNDNATGRIRLAS
jgi:diguanylate cyclase (GGDEF)-like protein